MNTGNPATAKVLAEVAAERARQDEKWGGAAHDDTRTTTEFAQMIQDFAGWARANFCMGGEQGRVNARRRLMQVAALAVAAVESFDRKARTAEKP